MLSSSQPMKLCGEASPGAGSLSGRTPPCWAYWQTQPRPSPAAALLGPSCGQLVCLLRQLRCPAVFLLQNYAFTRHITGGCIAATPRSGSWSAHCPRHLLRCCLAVHLALVLSGVVLLPAAAGTCLPSAQPAPIPAVSTASTPFHALSAVLPIDVAKTRIQTAFPGSVNNVGILQNMRLMWQTGDAACCFSATARYWQSA